MKKALALIGWTGLLSFLFFCVGFLAISRAATPRGVGRPLAMAETPDAARVAKRVERKVDTSNETLSKQIDVLSQRLESAVSNYDLLRKDFDAFRKDTDARFLKAVASCIPTENTLQLPTIHGFTPSWFVCAKCPQVKRESEDPSLPFHVVWSEVTEAELKALGIPENVGFPCFYWQDAFHRGWYCWNDGSSGDPTIKVLEAKWKRHR